MTFAGYRIDLFRGNGFARQWIPEHDSVSTWLDFDYKDVVSLCYSITQENKLGQRYIEPSDFLRNGIPASILATIVSSELCYSSDLRIHISPANRLLLP